MESSAQTETKPVYSKSWSCQNTQWFCVNLGMVSGKRMLSLAMQAALVISLLHLPVFALLMECRATGSVTSLALWLPVGLGGGYGVGGLDVEHGHQLWEVTMFCWVSWVSSDLSMFWKVLTDNNTNITRDNALYKGRWYSRRPFCLSWSMIYFRG